MIEHAGMLNHIFSKINTLNVSSNSKIVQNASQCFDISVWQSLTALIKGGTTYVYSKDLVLNPTEMISRLLQDKITILEVVPTFMNMILDNIDSNISLNDLEFCLVTGEEVKKTSVEKWFQHFPDKKIVNAYGPTEASDDITHYVMEHVPEYNTIPIGKTIQNLNIYIVDKDFKMCPIGISGGACCFWNGVGRGYVNNVEQTKLAFKKDPFKNENFNRLYKTGDYSCYLPDGNIGFWEELMIR